MYWLFILNSLAFLAVLSYTLYLFTHIVYSRYLFVKLGKKVEFKKAFNERVIVGFTLFDLILANQIRKK